MMTENKQPMITLLYCPKCSYYEYDKEYRIGKAPHRHWRRNLQSIDFYTIADYLQFLQNRKHEVKSG